MSGFSRRTTQKRDAWATRFGRVVKCESGASSRCPRSQKPAIYALAIRATESGEAQQGRGKKNSTTITQSQWHWPRIRNQTKEAASRTRLKSSSEIFPSLSLSARCKVVRAMFCSCSSLRFLPTISFNTVNSSSCVMNPSSFKS